MFDPTRIESLSKRFTEAGFDFTASWDASGVAVWTAAPFDTAMSAGPVSVRSEGGDAPNTCLDSAEMFIDLWGNPEVRKSLVKFKGEIEFVTLRGFKSLIG